MPPTPERATLGDLDALAPLFDGYRTFYEQASDLARARDFLRERMLREESVIFLARDGGTALGFTQLYPMFSSVRTAPVWVLNDLFVAAQARGRGVARSLLDVAMAHARATGAARMTLSTALTNTAAQRLYEAHGWTRDTEYCEYVAPL